MKGMILLANGFEDMEMITALDLLRRANIEVYTFSIYNDKRILSQSRVYYESDELLKNADFSEYDFLIIPGGKAVFSELNNQEIEAVVETFNKDKKLIASICAAPTILGKMGLLKNKNFTCFPSLENEVIEGIYQKQSTVELVDNYITSRSAGTAIDFALKIIEVLKGKEEALRIQNVIYYNVEVK
ncbi:MAG: DJ-1/PfpI family protein [Bacilli bacterium]|nr:DJ-1/PfpI family protein [Bacilli bacterium]